MEWNSFQAYIEGNLNISTKSKLPDHNTATELQHIFQEAGWHFIRRHLENRTRNNIALHIREFLFACIWKRVRKRKKVIRIPSDKTTCTDLSGILNLLEKKMQNNLFYISQ